jgi:hypothetical protein
MEIVVRVVMEGIAEEVLVGTYSVTVIVHAMAGVA